MSKVASYTKSGSKSTQSVSLPEEVFGIEVKSHDLLKQAYLSYLANRRNASAKTLQRGEVRGGGRKPWAQKRTGRARAGSIRSPIFKGGGVVFGPTGVENYQIRVTLKAKRQAIRQALSLKAADGAIKLIEALEFQGAKTKEAAQLLDKLEVSGKSVLLVANKQPELQRATRNLSRVELISPTYLNVFAVLNADYLVITKDALKAIELWLGKSTTKAAAKEKA